MYIKCVCILFLLQEECEEMVSLLRVVELQKILVYLNISFAGRKIDYQRRILQLLRTNFELIAPKIREVYTQSIVDQQANQYGPTEPKRMYSQMQMQPNAGGMVGANTAAQMGQAQQILNPANQAGMQAGVPPGNNVVPFLHTIPTQMPIHPDVRLRKLAFYDVLGTLIKPSSLVPRNAQRIQEVPFYFTLTPQQATEIASNRDIRNSSKIEHAIQVQLRFCLLETSCDQEDCFPPSVSVKVNNKLCQLPNVIPTNRPNVEPKRPPRPVNVTSNVKLSPTVTNTITVQWCPDYTRGYCIAVYLVKKLTSAQLLQRMKQKGVKPADYTRALIKEKLTEDADCEIATTMLKVSLNCPLGKMKMSIPCRASTCSHLQCFDASLYLQMNERKPTWNCPVCDKPAVYDNLVIDGYFQEVLASNLLKPDDTEIQLHKDGSWSTHSLRNEGQILDTPTKPVEKVEVISDDIELITTEDVKPVKAVASASLNTNEQPSSTTNSETVDLTLSDSDDDLPLAKRRPIAKQNTNQGAPSSTMNGNGGGAANQRGMYMQQKNVIKINTNRTKEISSLPLRTNCANNNNNSNNNNKSPNSDFFRHYNKLLNRIDIILNNVEDNNNNNNNSNSNNNNNDKNNNQLQKNAITITRSTNDNKPNGQISKLSSTNLQKAQNYEDITISRVMKRKK
ncbi:E3 SUMO-protein ligase PIAS4 isoform X3 [Lucilia cuprina]|uniref:E3 SUMO-protein ligase PIAS4 isoform X3 n=1 Tax=Lucilia cuprina TaxID=7375 RepID=UPI001F05C809|nr:E3 SUMO-protein ligase PIAS4 isoform X3 [Lucilia cuprina]